MSNSCSALATKVELQKVEAQIDDKLDKKEKEPIIKKASAIGASLAVATLDPRVQAVLAKLAGLAGKVASIAGKVLNLVGAVAGIFSLITSLASIAMVTVLQIRVAKLERKVAGLTSLVNDAFATANLANKRANEAITKANAATAAANLASADAARAIRDANNAIITSNSAVAQADNANRLAKLAQNDANTARADANRAIKTANAASADANIAIIEASRATVTANDANSRAETAIGKANVAISEVEQLRQENRQLKGLVITLQSRVERTEKQINQDDNQPSLTAKQALELARTNQKNIALKEADLKSDISEFKEESLQDKLRRERQELIDSKFKSQVELSAELEARKNEKFKSQTELQLELQRRILDKQNSELSREFKDTQDKISKLEKQLEQEQGIREKIIEKVIITKSGLTLDSPALKDLISEIADSRVATLEDVNQEQYKDILEKIGGVPTLVGTTVVGGLAPTLGNLGNKINKIALNTTPVALTDAAAAGVCQSTQPGGCMQRNVVDKLSNNIGDVVNAAGTSFAAANNALLIKMSGTLNVVKNTTNTIKATTAATLGIVDNAKHGLAAIQNFASTAWKASGADKVVQTVSAVASLHNAAMLSQNAAQSVGDVITNGLSLFNIKGFDGQPIDVNAAVGGAIRNKLVSVFGETNLNAASEAWLRLNRIHQAVSSTVYAIQGTKNALLEADEITGGHIAKIGNALQEQGMVEDDTYDWMNPEPDYQQPFKGILGKIDSIEDMTNRVSSVVSTGLEIKENTTELVTSSSELVDATNSFLELKSTDESTKKAESESPNIDRNDLVRDEESEET